MLKPTHKWKNQPDSKVTFKSVKHSITPDMILTIIFQAVAHETYEIEHNSTPKKITRKSIEKSLLSELQYYGSHKFEDNEYKDYNKDYTYNDHVKRYDIDLKSHDPNYELAVKHLKRDESILSRTKALASKLFNDWFPYDNSVDFIMKK